MGWGKALSAVVVMSISVMLVFSVLPVGADTGSCNGPWTSISVIDAIANTDMENPASYDRNGNGYVCWKMKGTGEYHFKDDRPIK